MNQNRVDKFLKLYNYKSKNIYKHIFANHKKYYMYS